MIKISLHKLSAIDVLVFILILNTVISTGAIYFIAIELLSIGYILLHYLTRRSGNSIYSKHMILFVLYCILSIIWSVSPYTTLIGVRGAFEAMLVGYCISRYTQESGGFSKVVTYYVVASFVLLAIVMTSSPFSTLITSRLGANAVYNANTIALVFAFSGILFLIKKKNRIRANVFLYEILCIVLILLSGSRKGLIVYAAGIMIVFFLKSKPNKRIIAVVLIPFLILLAYYLLMEIPALYNVAGYRLDMLLKVFAGKASVEVDSSLRIRAGMMDSAMSIWQQHYLLGSGLNTYQLLSGWGTYAHNNLYELLACTGIIGCLLYYSMYLEMVIKLLKRRNILKIDEWISILISFVIIFLDIGMVSYGEPFMQMTIALFIASSGLGKKVKNVYKGRN